MGGEGGVERVSVEAGGVEGLDRVHGEWDGGRRQ